MMSDSVAATAVPTVRARQPHVLMVQSSSHAGGSEVYNWQRWRRLRAAGLAVDVVFIDDEGPVAARYAADGYAPPHLCAQDRPFWQTWRALRRIIDGRPYNILHLFGLRANLFGRLLAWRRPHLRVIADQRSIDPWRRPHHNALDRLTGRRVDLFLANCRAVDDWLTRLHHPPLARRRLLYTGIDLEVFAPPALNGRRLTAAVPAGNGAAADTPRLICVANYRPAKGHDRLITALAHLARAGHTPRLWLVGRGDWEPLRRVAIAAGVDGQVEIFGPRDDVPALLQAADIAVLASRWEGLPVSLLEAMAAGLPVVATDVGGIGELVTDGVTGRLIPDGPDAAVAATLAGALRELIGAPAVRARLGVAARDRVRTHFNLDDRVVQLRVLYEALLHETGVAG